MSTEHPQIDGSRGIPRGRDRGAVQVSAGPLRDMALTRRHLLRAGIAGGFIVVSAGCGGGGAGGGSSSSTEVVARKEGESAKEYLDRLHQAAKAEGQVLVYGEADSEQFATDKKAFAATYPGVNMRFVSGNSEVMTQRALTEQRSGHPQADAYVDGSSDTMRILQSGGGLVKYHPVGERNMDKRFIFDGPYIPDAYISKHVAFNTKLISADEMPHTWDGYLAPRFKGGKLALDTNSTEWVAGLILAMGKKPARSFLENLTKMDVTLVDGTTLRTEQLAAGEFPVMLDGYGHSLKEFIEDGKPIQVVVPAPGHTITAIPDMSALLKDAPHPNAARLLLEFLLMPAGQKVYTHETKPSTLKKGTKAPYPEFMKGSRLVILSPAKSDLVKLASNWWQELFIKK